MRLLASHMRELKKKTRCLTFQFKYHKGIKVSPEPNKGNLFLIIPAVFQIHVELEWASMANSNYNVINNGVPYSGFSIRQCFAAVYGYCVLLYAMWFCWTICVSMAPLGEHNEAHGQLQYNQSQSELDALFCNSSLTYYDSPKCSLCSLNRYGMVYGSYFWGAITVRYVRVALLCQLL